MVLKTARLARLLNDGVYQSIFQYEAGGNPSDADGVPPTIYELAVVAGREYQEVDLKTKELKRYVYPESISQLEEAIRITDNALLAATDPDDSSDLANAVFPATDSVRNRSVAGKDIAVKLGGENYINRLIAFVDDRATSGRFKEIVGSHLDYLGNRLDAVFKAAQKGSHSDLISKEEADRYVVYTYLLAGDILSL